MLKDLKADHKVRWVFILHPYKPCLKFISWTWKMDLRMLFLSSKLMSLYCSPCLKKSWSSSCKRRRILVVFEINYALYFCVKFNTYNLSIATGFAFIFERLGRVNERLNNWLNVNIWIVKSLLWYSKCCC